MILAPNANPTTILDRLEDARDKLAVRLAVCGEWEGDPGSVIVVQRQREYDALKAQAESLGRAIDWYKTFAYSLTNDLSRQ